MQVRKPGYLTIAHEYTFFALTATLPPSHAAILNLRTILHNRHLAPTPPGRRPLTDLPRPRQTLQLIQAI